MRSWHRRLLLNTNPILSRLRTASRLARVGAIVLAAQCLDMSSASKTGMNTCALTAHGRLEVAARMRPSGRTMRRAVRTGRQIRSIRRCRSRRRGRFMTMDRGRSARLPVVRGRRGRLAILLGEVGFWGSCGLGLVYAYHEKFSSRKRQVHSSPRSAPFIYCALTSRILPRPTIISVQQGKSPFL